MLEARRFRPIDLVLGRSWGQGSSLFFPVFQPGVPIVNLFDYYLHPHRNDLAEETGLEMPAEYFHWRRAANAMDLLDLENGIIPWTHTAWQRDLFPREYQEDFLVHFDGIDTARSGRVSETPDRVIQGRTIPAETRVITFVARNLEQLRGFDRFMELANRLMRKRNDLLCVVVGGFQVQRGLDVRFYGKNYRDHVLSQNPAHDPERLWFLGSVMPAVVAEVLKASDLHIYPSRPYVVSRSLVQAMAAGCVILAADTAPVSEFIKPEQTGILVPPDNPDAWEEQAGAILDHFGDYRELGLAAAKEARERFSQDATLPGLAQAFDLVASGVKV
jgi:glycosyltransferase involved in cell wall biosynthesis